MTGSESGPPTGTLVVPLDGSELAACAAAAAARLAPRLDARVHFVSVASTQDDADVVRRQFDVAADLVPEASREIVMADGGAVSADTVTRAITEVVTRLGGVVCMASHGRGRSAAVLGSVAEAVTAQSGGPVIIVGPAFDPEAWATHAAVVVCVDGTPESEAVVPIALGWARALAVPLSILTVAEPVPTPIPGRSWQRMHGPDEDAARYLAALADRYLESGVSVEVAVAYDPVSVATGLTDHLEEHPATLVAVATRARRGLGRLVMVSNAARILHEVPVPVLAVARPHRT